MVRERQGTFSGEQLARKEQPRVHAEHLHPGELLALGGFGSSCFYDGKTAAKTSAQFIAARIRGRPSRLFAFYRVVDRLVPITRRCIIKSTPASYFAVLHCEDMHPFALKPLFRIACGGFEVSKYRVVFVRLNELSHVEDSNIFGLIDGSKKLTYLGWISTQARIGHTRRDSLLPINFVTDQFQKRRYISATKSCVTLLCYLERVAHSFWSLAVWCG